ncbi:MAG: hypothetical protein QW420_02840 [Candidatus Caldarchaeum sp.]
MTRFYCDVHRKKDETGYRITYTTDGEVFKHVDSPTKIPAEAGDQVFVDTIPIMHTDGFIELLKRGVEVYYLRRLTLIKATRQKMGITSKSAKTDIKILMMVEERWFKSVDEGFLAMRQLISPFRRLERTKQRLENQYKDVPDAAKQSFKRLIDHIEEEKLIIARPIVEEAERRYPIFRTIAEELGITGENHLLAREALAELLTYVDFNLSFTKIRRYLGLYPGHGKRYHHDARRALERLTRGLITGTITAKHLTEIAKTIWMTIRRETQRLAGIPAQQQG